MPSRSGSAPPRPRSSSAEPPPWLAAAPGGVVLAVRVQPGASRSGIAGRHGEALKVQVRARPVEGAANRELLTVLADALAVRSAVLTLESGHHGRAKRVHVAGLDVETAALRLARFVDKPGGSD